MIRSIVLLALVLGLGTGLVAQEGPGAEEDLDLLFGDNTDIEAVPDEKVELSEISANKAVVFQGDILAQAGVVSGISSYSSSSDGSLPFSSTVFYQMKGNLSFDARPDKDFRVFGRLHTELPRADGSLSFEQLSVDELFFDLTVLDSVFVRAGKQNLSLGMGINNYLAGLTDNLTVKISAPLWGWNLSAVVIARDAFMTGGAGDYPGLLFAGSIEGSLGPASLGILGMNQRSLRPSAQVYAKSSLFGVDTMVSGVFSFRPDGSVIPRGLLGLFWEGFDPLLRLTLDYDFNAETPGLRDHTLSLMAYMPSIPGANLRPGLTWKHTFHDNSGEVRAGVELFPLAHVKLILGIPVVYGPADGRYVQANTDPLKRVLAGAFALEVSGKF